MAIRQIDTLVQKYEPLLVAKTLTYGFVGLWSPLLCIQHRARSVLVWQSKWYCNVWSEDQIRDMKPKRCVPWIRGENMGRWDTGELFGPWPQIDPLKISDESILVVKRVAKASVSSCAV